MGRGFWRSRLQATSTASASPAAGVRRAVKCGINRAGEFLLEQASCMEAETGGTAYEDAVLEVLYTLEKVCRDGGGGESANR